MDDERHASQWRQWHEDMAARAMVRSESMSTLGALARHIASETGTVARSWWRTHHNARPPGLTHVVAMVQAAGGSANDLEVGARRAAAIGCGECAAAVRAIEAGGWDGLRGGR